MDVVMPELEMDAAAGATEPEALVAANDNAPVLRHRLLRLVDAE